MTAARIVTPLRFVAGVIGLWIAARVVVLVPDLVGAPAEADSPAAVAVVPASGQAQRRLPIGAPGSAASSAVASADGRWTFAQVSHRPLRHPDESRDPRIRNAGEGKQSARMDPGFRRDDGDGAATAPIQETSIISPAGIVSLPTPAVATPSRWSGNLYFYRRGEGGAFALATGGQLGTSQAGARIAYRLNPAGPTRFAAAARLSTPLDDWRGAEAAVGIDWHPLPAAPLRVSVERRIDLGGGARHAWSAYAAGGFWREVRPGIVLDGYAQAGVVGANRRDLFADGALRAGHRRMLGDGRALIVGAGAWAAAQPRAERLDIGPRVALGLPAGGTTITVAAEWRARVAGDAAPPSGLAITVAADF